MADDEPDRLSQLPDELLQHIIQLAPSREAESTAVLSRRWRGLWPPATCAVKFSIPSIDSDRFHRRRRDASMRGAKEALAAAQGPVKSLSIHVGEGCGFLDVVVGDVLSYRASRGVQDVRIAADTSSRNRKTCYYDDDNYDNSPSSLPDHRAGEFEFSFGSVASAALRLRVLHITNCRELTPPPRASTFPCLEVLRLRKCSVHLQRLQDMVVASPQLAALQLEYVFFSTGARGSPMSAAQWQANKWQQGYYNRSDGHYYSYRVDDYSARHYWDLAQSFCCPGITTLVLLNCCYEWGNYIAIELDVPRVQHFRYRGKISQFTLRSPLPDVRRVYLHILVDSYGTGDTIMCEMFWNFLNNFGNTKILKLKLENPIDIFAVLDKKRFRELTGEMLFDVQYLEIDARYNPASKDVAVAIGNLLQCCPAVVDLRLKLTTVNKPWRRKNSWSSSLRNKAQLEFHKSIDHFKRRRDRPVIPLCGDKSDNDKVEAVTDIPGLSNKWFQFSCLRFHLRRLSLQFQMDKPDCVGVQLAKFFIERGMALEEMYIDDGNMRLWEHMSCKISGYAASPQPSAEHHVLARMSQGIGMNQFSSSKISGWFQHRRLEVRRTHPLSAVSRSFTILPLADA